MKPTKRSSLFLFSLFFGALASAQGVTPTTPLAKISLEQVRENIANKNAIEAIRVLKTEHRRLLKSEKDFRDLSRWLSIFVLEETLASYEKALELAEKDPSSAQEEFVKLLETEPYNKTIWSSYITFLIDGKKHAEAEVAIQKARALFPYFSIYSVYAALLAYETGRTPQLSACDRRAMTDLELELCQLTRFKMKVSPLAGSAKKIAPGEIKLALKQVTIPDIYYWVWRGSQDQKELKKYVSLCQSLTEKDKKNYRTVPLLCAKILAAEEVLQPQKSDDANPQ